jgi:hypothetical protein
MGSTSGTRGRRLRTSSSRLTLVVSTLVPGIPFYEQLGVAEERMHTLMGRLDEVKIWDKRQEMKDEQVTPVVSTLVPGILYYEQLGWRRRGCALSWDDCMRSTSGTRGRIRRISSSHLW